MATTQNTYTKTNSNGPSFSFTFPYIKTADIQVTVDGATQTENTHYVFNTATSIEFLLPHIPTPGAVIKIARTTNIDNGPENSFFTGSSIAASKLNDNFDQVIFRTQEMSNSLSVFDSTYTFPGGVGRTYQSRLEDYVSVKDFGAYGDGVTDDTTAFVNALASGNTVRVPVGVYKITSTLDFANSDLIGEGWGSIIEGHIASRTDPLIKAGRSVLIDNLCLRYRSGLIDNDISSSAITQGQRVLIYTAGGDYLGQDLPLQRGSQISNCLLHDCGTAVYSPSSPNQPVFSTKFETIEVTQFAYKGFDLQSETRTGNVYSNIYLKSDRSGVECVFELGGEESETVINQLNLEHTVCSEAVLKLTGARALAANSIHIEGCDISQSDKGYVLFENSAGSIESLSVYYTRMSENNTAIVKLGSIDYDDFGTQHDPDVMNYLRIGVLHLKGIAQPDAGVYPSYPATRRGLIAPSNISGFNIFERPIPNITPPQTFDMNVRVDHYVYNCPVGEQQVYIDYPTSGNIAFISKGLHFKHVDGPWFSANSMLVGADSDVAHPYLVDRNGDDYRPTYTWWFDPNTGFSHPFVDPDLATPPHIGVTINNNDRFRFTINSFIPSFTNQASLGSSGNRWTELFATNGTINTSDSREKQDIEALNAAELRVAQALKGLIKKYRFNHAVEAKGDSARIHTGIIAQDVVAAFAAEGLDANRYGLLCYDEWDALPEIRSEDGAIQQHAKAAGSMYGIRYEELLAFVIAAL